MSNGRESGVRPLTRPPPHLRKRSSPNHSEGLSTSRPPKVPGWCIAAHSAHTPPKLLPPKARCRGSRDAPYASCSPAKGGVVSGSRCEVQRERLLLPGMRLVQGGDGRQERCSRHQAASARHTAPGQQGAHTAARRSAASSCKQRRRRLATLLRLHESRLQRSGGGREGTVGSRRAAQRLKPPPAKQPSLCCSHTHTSHLARCLADRAAAHGSGRPQRGRPLQPGTVAPAPQRSAQQPSRPRATSAC